MNGSSTINQKTIAKLITRLFLNDWWVLLKLKTDDYDFDIIIPDLESGIRKDVKGVKNGKTQICQQNGNYA